MTTWASCNEAINPHAPDIIKPEIPYLFARKRTGLSAMAKKEDLRSCKVQKLTRILEIGQKCLIRKTVLPKS